MKHRLPYRLLHHYLPIAGASALSVFLLYITRPYKDVLTRASFATAYPAAALLSLTLLLGPLNILRKRRNPVSSDLRRDIGICAGILTLAHVAVGQFVHLRGRPWLYYVYSAAEKHSGPRHDLFGVSNYAGAVATLLVLALLVTSNDRSLRALGTPRWKRLQRWNYAVFALAAFHGFGYQAIETQKPWWIAVLAACVGVAIALQLAGLWSRRSGRGSKVPLQALTSEKSNSSQAKPL